MWGGGESDPRGESIWDLRKRGVGRLVRAGVEVFDGGDMDEIWMRM